MTIREWAKMYVEDIVRATWPHTPLDAENVLQSFERVHPNYSLDEPVSSTAEDTLIELGDLLDVMTKGKLHLLHHEQTGCMHPGI